MDLGGRLAGLPPARLADALEGLIVGAHLENESFGGISELNNDGLPLQLSLSSSREGIGVRLVADPAASVATPERRYVAAKSALARTLEAGSAGALGPACETLLKHFLGDAIADDGEPREGALSSYRRGVFWLAHGAGSPGAAIYLDMKPCDPARVWEETARWLSDCLPRGAGHEAVLARLCGFASLASVGLEGTAVDRGRAKIYWRLKRALLLSNTGIDALSDPAFAEFLGAVIGERSMPLSGTVMSAGWDLASGELADAKMDLCGHCLPRPSGEWAEIISALCSRFRLYDLPVKQALEDERCEVGFFGFGLDRKRRKRLNLYLKPVPFNDRNLSSDALRGRIARAVSYLLALQKPDGSWSDYELPTGASTEWVTALAGLALAIVSRGGRFPEARAAAHRAARWLDEARSYDAGWGYNGSTGADADSTGFAIRLHKCLGLPVREEDMRFLLGHWRSQGGFATFDSPDSWGAPHPCVTAAAAQALDQSDIESLGPSLVRAIEVERLGDGSWPSYWWHRHHYSTFQHLLLVRRLGLEDLIDSRIPVSASLDALTSFDLACAAGAMQLSDPFSATVKDLFRNLLARQHADGRWPGGFNLRVTDSALRRPWEEAESGVLYSDYFGSVSTSMALMALDLMIEGES